MSADYALTLRVTSVASRAPSLAFALDRGATQAIVKVGAGGTGKDAAGLRHRG